MRSAADIAREAVALCMKQVDPEGSSLDPPHYRDIARIAALYAAEICIREANEMMSEVVRMREEPKT